MGEGEFGRTDGAQQVRGVDGLELARGVTAAEFDRLGASGFGEERIQVARGDAALVVVLNRGGYGSVLTV